MMRIFLMSIVLFIAACSTYVDAPATGVWSWPAPPEFGHPFAGSTELHLLGWAEVDAACSELLGFDAQYYGCAKSDGFGIDNNCIIIVINETRGTATREAVLAHEQAHCNGWPADHNGTTPNG